MELIAFIREHIWAHLPSKESVTPRTRVTAALLWGLFLPLLLILSAWLRHRDELDWSRAPLYYLLGGVVLGLALLTPGLGQHLYIFILRAFSLVGFVVSNVGLAVIFYVIVTPVGALLKLFGTDAMDAGFKKGEPPKWRAHATKTDPRRFYRLF